MGDIPPEHTQHGEGQQTPSLMDQGSSPSSVAPDQLFIPRGLSFLICKTTTSV